MKESSSPSCACIIPFYNEGKRIFSVIESLLKVSNISEIFCVDDGSENSQTRDEIKRRFPQVSLLIHTKNQGKSAAVQTALAHVSCEYVFLIDADLQHVVPEEIEHGIQVILHDTSVDMVIFRRLSDPWYSQIVRGEILTSGERILRTSDLKTVFLEHPKGYQLEYGINFYMMRNKKNAYWVRYSARNTKKIDKFGFLTGITKELLMYRHMMEYAGIVLPLQSILFFCHKEYRKNTARI